MPALWQASQRPMYIRAVWVDGFRHAILTHDDPHYIELNSKRRRPHSSASVNPKRKAQSSRLSYHRDSNCLSKLDLAITSDRIAISQEPDIEKLNLTEVEAGDELYLKSPVPLSTIDNFQAKLEPAEMRGVKSNRTARTDVKENNELSDRVLQWLDLAGKVDLLTSENAERMNQPRHSWPEIQRRNLTKSRTVNDLRSRESKVLTTENKMSDTIDRRELCVPTSATTIENYARQSRNNKSTSRESHVKTKENKKVKDYRASVVETRRKMINERSAMEKQYAELVNKKIIPDLSTTKKQVHIFMPEAITKKFTSTANSRTGSL